MKRLMIARTLFCIPAYLLVCISTFPQAPAKDLSYYITHAPFKMPTVTVPQFAAHSFNITDFGAVGNGQTLNTAAFEKAIAACVAAGGGKVIVPAGSWLTGPIQLKSNIDLHVERGALILFTSDHTQYPMIKAGSSSTNIVPASPIYGYDLKNIAITGEGVIDGAGESWRPVKKEKTTASQWKNFTSTGGVVSSDGNIWWPTQEAMDGENFLKQLKNKNSHPSPDDYLPARDYLRPYMLYLVNCENVLLQGITLRNSPKFVFYPNHCTNLSMLHVNIFNEWWAQNGDGIDISASKNVVIYQCTVSAGDDGICMKSGGGKSDVRGTFNLENILIAGCVVYHAHGGFVIGSNTDGGMRNIFVADCNFIGTDVGIRVKSNAGRGGLVKDIFVQDIFMSNIANEAVLFDTYYEDAPAGTVKDASKPTPADKVPEFRDFHISRIYCNGAKTAIAITGLPQMPVNKIYFEDIIISAGKGLVATEASNINLKNVKLVTGKDPVYILNNATNISINGGYFSPGNKVFVQAEGKTSGVKITATNLRKSTEAILLGANVDKQAVVTE